MPRLILLPFVFTLLFPAPLFAQETFPPPESQLSSILSSLQSLLNQLSNLSTYRISPQTQLAQISGAGSGLIAHYTFDEGSGTTANDSSGNNNTGTLASGPVWVTGTSARVGTGALSFDGANDYTDIGNGSSLQLTGAMTISAWIKADNLTNTGRIIAKQGGPGNRSWGLNLETDSKLYFHIASSASTLIVVNTTNTFLTGQWIHVVGVYEPSVATRIYTNGVLNNSNTTGIPASQYNNALNVNIGRRPDGTGYFDGTIDDLRIYNRVLTPSEITDLYNLGTGSPTQQSTGDIIAPTAPTSLTATAVSSSQINLSWTASTDASGIGGYKIYRGGTLIATTIGSATTYSNSGLSANTTYSYTVAAYDASTNANTSAQSASVSATTQVSSPPPSGTTFYIRQGATGANNGSDWNNAYTSLPATLQRGATYYIADGTYGGYTFDDPVLGIQIITIKKATIADHGINTGWNNTYGDGQAEFGQLIFEANNYRFDGQVRNNNNWNDGSSYGFSVFIVSTYGIQLINAENIEIGSRLDKKAISSAIFFE